MKIRKDDNVVVIAGKDKGKSGRVRVAYPKDNKLLIEGINFVKRHTRARAQVRQAGIIERESTIDSSDVMVVCGKCNKPTRVGFRFLRGGKKVRFCCSCGEVID